MTPEEIAALSNAKMADLTAEQKEAVLAHFRGLMDQMKGGIEDLLKAMGPGREFALARTNFQQAFFWLAEGVEIEAGKL